MLIALGSDANTLAPYDAASRENQPILLPTSRNWPAFGIGCERLADDLSDDWEEGQGHH